MRPHDGPACTLYAHEDGFRAERCLPVMVTTSVAWPARWTNLRRFRMRMDTAEQGGVRSARPRHLRGPSRQLRGLEPGGRSRPLWVSSGGRRSHQARGDTTRGRDRGDHDGSWVRRRGTFHVLGRRECVSDEPPPPAPAASPGEGVGVLCDAGRHAVCSGVPCAAPLAGASRAECDDRCDGIGSRRRPSR